MQQMSRKFAIFMQHVYMFLSKLSKLHIIFYFPIFNLNWPYCATIITLKFFRSALTITYFSNKDALSMSFASSPCCTFLVQMFLKLVSLLPNCFFHLSLHKTDFNHFLKPLPKWWTTKFSKVSKEIFKEN